jgi:2,3-dihydroxybenzoate decarboxylase
VKGVSIVKGKIVFEEHMSLPETLEDSRTFVGGSANWGDFERQILDVGDERIEGMETNGIELAILSLNAPAIQGIWDTNKAIATAKRANDYLANAIARHPDRFAGFAALPMQDPDAASIELTRCVREYGFKGALVNGFTQKNAPDSALYYDLPEYRSFWATVSELDVPF